MLKLGLTGGIGSGKSTVAQLFKQLGAFVLDSDQIYNEVITPGSRGLEQLAMAFGQEIILDHSRELDRKALAKIVFNDKARFAKLTSITRPLIRDRTIEILATLPTDSIVVHDSPLLFEQNLQSTYHLVISVISDLDNRLSRLAEYRGMSREDSLSRISNQLDDQYRIENSDVTIENNTSLENIADQLDFLWTNRIAIFADNLIKKNNQKKYFTSWSEQIDRSHELAKVRISTKLSEFSPRTVDNSFVIEAVNFPMNVETQLTNRIADCGFIPSNSDNYIQNFEYADPWLNLDLIVNYS